MLDSSTQFNADRLYSPQYNNSGETAFFHDKKDEPLSDEAISSLVTEFKKASPTHTDLHQEIVQAVRRVLWIEKIDDLPMLATFSRYCLFYFLENCQLQIKPDDDDGNTKVRAIFTSMQVHANYTTCTPETASTVRCTVSEVDIPGSEYDEEEPSANKEVSDWLGAVCEPLERSNVQRALAPN
ncbi:uncharacterized protein FMAN_00302 [Fusarium mangiferae]|uniref:Uncharacterized protein n=1 Tax=Fusarium mangiferae TaxID=192010 RepID=A0A1L7TWA2_FUSMA|nr:uncharacterized protein FMAN_00302 [Fusarium mangiferae]CVL02870.1 uncharacterized protein FMAN_00302 [Fusarium mangiferae]